jgi:hypothetical protein
MSMAPPSIAPGTLYADWLARRERLRDYHGEREPIVAVQLRVLDYLIDRYRDDATALKAAPPPLDTVYLNQRAVVINHHRAFGLVAGVKSAEEATNRVATIVARMYDPERSAEPTIDLASAPVLKDPWFGWSEPNRRTVAEYWRDHLFALRWFGDLNESRLAVRMEVMPFLPRVMIDHLCERVAATGQEDARAADVLARCRNRVVVSYVARAWRDRIAAGRHGVVTNTLRNTLLDWDSYAADTVRGLLADEIADVRMAAADLIAEIGELRDIGILADLLAMAELPDEHPTERVVLADAMEKLATHVQSTRRALADQS